jgi:hypothetical protein
MDKDEGHQEPPQFGGKPGEAVPAVDPADIKTVRQIQREVQARNPGKQIAAGFELLKHICTPGADIPAIGFRASIPWVINLMAPEQLARFSEDAVCRAAAKVPAEWVGVEVTRDGLPFDMNEFLRLCAEEPV